MLNTPMANPQEKPSTNYFPACRVCHGPGNGLHYGVNTCDACKGFFHRTIKLHLQYTCKEDSTCKITYGRGKMCQQCRYQKCISVGMSKHAIKTGRYTLSRKADCIMERKEEEKMKRCSSKSTCSSENQSARSPDMLCTDDKNNTLSHKDTPRNTASDDDSSMTQSLSQLAASMTPISSLDCENSLYSTASTSSDSDTMSSSDSTLLIQRILHNIKDTQSKAESPKVSSFNNPTAIISTFGNVGIDEDGVNYNVNSTSSLTIEIKEDSRTLKTSSSPKNSSNSCTINKDSYCYPLSASLPVEKDSNELISNLYIHKDVVIRTLLEARLTADTACKHTPQELEKQSLEYYETCKMKREMFGQLHQLSEEEYDQVMEQTGIDADGRKSFLTQYLDGMESLLRVMVHFAKVIPGFKSLDLDDQIGLVKYNRLEFNLILNYPYSNVELGVIHCQNNKWLCIHEAFSYKLYWMGKEYVDIQGEFQNLNLNEEEQAILWAISAMTPGRSEVTNKSPIHEIYRNLTDVLIHCLGKRHKNPHHMFGSIMQILIRYKQLEGSFKSIIGDLNIPKYSQLSKRPLLKDMISDFYVSTSGT